MAVALNGQTADPTVASEKLHASEECVLGSLDVHLQKDVRVCRKLQQPLGDVDHENALGLKVQTVRVDG